MTKGGTATMGGARIGAPSMGGIKTGGAPKMSLGGSIEGGRFGGANTTFSSRGLAEFGRPSAGTASPKAGLEGQKMSVFSGSARLRAGETAPSKPAHMQLRSPDRIAASGVKPESTVKKQGFNPRELSKFDPMNPAHTKVDNLPFRAPSIDIRTRMQPVKDVPAVNPERQARNNENIVRPVTSDRKVPVKPGLAQPSENTPANTTRIAEIRNELSSMRARAEKKAVKNPGVGVFYLKNDIARVIVQGSDGLYRDAGLYTTEQVEIKFGIKKPVVEPRRDSKSAEYALALINARKRQKEQREETEDEITHSTPDRTVGAKIRLNIFKEKVAALLKKTATAPVVLPQPGTSPQPLQVKKESVAVFAEVQAARAQLAKEISHDIAPAQQAQVSSITAPLEQRAVAIAASLSSPAGVVQPAPENRAAPIAAVQPTKTEKTGQPPPENVIYRNNSKPKKTEGMPYSEAEETLAARRTEARDALVLALITARQARGRVDGTQIVRYLPGPTRRNTSPVVDVGRDITYFDVQSDIARMQVYTPDSAVATINDITARYRPVKFGHGRGVTPDEIRRVLRDRPDERILEAAQH